MSYFSFFDVDEPPDEELEEWLLVALGGELLSGKESPLSFATSSKFAPGEPEKLTIIPVVILAPPTRTGLVPVNFQKGIIFLLLGIDDAYSYA
tara:strand:- start:136 stop:414 length:279 start_codon:yes stop_codon:yes gene_type:complete